MVLGVWRIPRGCTGANRLCRTAVISVSVQDEKREISANPPSEGKVLWFRGSLQGMCGSGDVLPKTVSGTMLKNGGIAMFLLGD